jgi:SNF2 family DNA or RNA helicase
MNGQLLLGNDHLVLVFPYDKEHVTRVKSIKGSQWDATSKSWRVPLNQYGLATQVALELGWWISPEVAVLDIPSKGEDHMTLEDNKVHLYFGFDPVKVRAAKRIPGITWDKKTSGWVAPISSLSECADWADQFNVHVSEDTRAMISEITETRNKLIEDSRLTDADLDVAGLPLLPYQRAGVKYASTARRCFIADDMGLGKTLQAIATLEYVENAYPAVVVCPPTLVLNWKKEYEKWLPHRNVATVKNRSEFPEDGYDVVVVGYSNINAWVNRLQKHRSYVFDESHYCKSPDAQRTKAAVKMARSAPKDGMVLCLTGTPVTNRPAEYAPQLDMLGKLSDFGGKWGFYRRYCNAFRDRFGQWNISGNSNLDELNDRLRGNCYIRRTKDQVLEELPPVRHNVVVVEGSDAGLKEYRKAEKDIINYLMDRAREIARELGEPPNSAAVKAKMRAERNEHLVKIGVLRKLAAKAKMAAVHEWIDSRIESGSKVVVAAHHREIVDELAAKYGNLKIQGGMDVSDVELNKQAFQEKDVADAPVMVLSIQAAKTGHTLTASQDVLFVELPWTPSDVDQTYSRCHRLGQKGSVTATYMLCQGTIDEKIYGVIEEKRNVVNAATEGKTPASAGDSVFDLFMSMSMND